MTRKTVQENLAGSAKIEIACPRCGETRILSKDGRVYTCDVCSYTFIPR